MAELRTRNCGNVACAWLDSAFDSVMRCGMNRHAVEMDLVRVRRRLDRIENLKEISK